MSVESPEENQASETTDEEANPNQTHVSEDLRGVFKADGLEIHFDFSEKKKMKEEEFDDEECEQFFIGEA